MAIFRGCFLPDKTISANEQNKPISKTCKEWMIYMDDPNLIPEVPIKIESSILIHTIKLFTPGNVQEM